MAMRVQSASHSSMECVVRMSEHCSLFVTTSLITRHMNLLAIGSMPVEGSTQINKGTKSQKAQMSNDLHIMSDQLNIIITMLQAATASTAHLLSSHHFHLAAYLPSKKTMLGSPIMAMATDSLRLLPPEKPPVARSAYSTRPISRSFTSTASSTSSAGTPFTAA